MTNKPRLATSADVDGVRRVVEAAYSHYVTRLGRRPAPMDADYQAAVAAGRTWVLGDAEVWAVLVLVPAADHLLIENVAVLPACQGQGLGRRLLAFAEQRARTAGLPEVRLYTNQRMTENLSGISDWTMRRPAGRSKMATPASSSASGSTDQAPKPAVTIDTFDRS